MILKIQALRYRCFRFIDQDLERFHVLVGPNASGKTTFLDVVSFLSDLVSEGPEQAIQNRSQDMHDLFWKQKGSRFQLAIECAIPEKRRAKLENGGKGFDRCRYEVEVGLSEQQEISIFTETLLLKKAEKTVPQLRLQFPSPLEPPDSILSIRGKKGTKTVVNKVEEGNDNFYDETGKKWDHAFKLGPRKSALANLPEDESKFPVATWFKQLLLGGVETLVLNSQMMRKSSPPGLPKGYRPDGSNLPWVIHELASKNIDGFNEWVAHVRTALPDVKTIQTIERPEDRHRYLKLVYENNLEVPSWLVSDGTLRMLALTLLAYLPQANKIYLIEEPENGIHPRAIETVIQSLSSIYASQVLIATHSPVVLSIVEPADVLCFAKADDGASDIVRGSEHPALKEWKGETNLGVLFAGGVLG